MLTRKDILKAGAAGLISGIVMFIPMIYLVFGAQVAPFNMPPSAAFAEALGINFAPPVAPILHFAYAILGGIVYLLLFRNDLTLTNAVVLGGVMWLIMMVVYSPIIGWGFFGFGEGQALPADDPMHLGPPVQYMIVTLAFHALYAVVLWLGARGLIGRVASLRHA